MNSEYETDPRTEEQPAEALYEEFDISSFDFTVRDPGEASAEAPEPPTPSVEPPKEEKPSPSPRSLPEKKGWFGLPDYRALDRRALKNKLRRYLRYALRPAGLYENVHEPIWWMFLTGCCGFMALFYLLVGLDWMQADLISGGRLAAFVLTGALMGGAAALGFAMLTSLTARLCREDAVRPFRLLSSLAGAWVFPSLVLLLGLVLSLCGCAVSMSFGLMALLWWIFTLTEVLKDLFGPRYLPILTVTVLWGMALFGLISVTFTLK